MTDAGSSREADESIAPVFIEGVDYYFDQGLVVFTEHYLRKCGYCCQSGCRHCPYPPSQKNTTAF